MASRLERFEVFTEYEATDLMVGPIAVCIDVQWHSLKITPTPFEVSALTQAVPTLS